MMDSMDAARIIGYFKGKTILITGSTGFLGKILVEKIVRVQPDVSRIYLLVRATDAASAKQRVQQEVTGTELFSLLRDKYGEGFDLFIQEKLIPLAGDITKEDLGLEPATFDDLAKEMDVIVNVAATTNFYGRSMRGDILCARRKNYLKCGVVVDYDAGLHAHMQDVS